MKILVTGFEPFGGDETNSSQQVLSRLRDNIFGADIIRLTLPVVRGECSRRVEQAIEEFRPDAVVLLGQAGGRKEISVEWVAVNLEDYRIPDNGGNRPLDQRVVLGGPDAYLCRLPVKGMVHAMKEAGVSAGTSLSAGSYVCNHLYYSTAHYLEQRYPKVKAVFIHLPAMADLADYPAEPPAMDLDDLVRGVTAGIQHLVEKRWVWTAGM